MTEADKKTLTTVYLPGEGRPHLEACMAATFDHCRGHGVKTVVIYTANGVGPCLAVERFCSRQEFAEIRVVAVTPPVKKSYVADPRDLSLGTVQTGIIGDKRRQLHEAGVPIVSSRLPFAPLHSEAAQADPMMLVERAFGVLGGGFAFCIQAAMMACDAGAVQPNERIAAMTADTSLVLLASHSESFGSDTHGLLVEHIICRPSLYDVSRPKHTATMRAKAAAEAPAPAPLLEKGEEK